jgi:hypothetical protein
MISLAEFRREVAKHPNLIISLMGGTWDVLNDEWMDKFSFFRAVRSDGGADQIFRGILGTNYEHEEVEEHQSLASTGKAKPFFRTLLNDEVDNCVTPQYVVDEQTPPTFFHKPGTTSSFFRMLLE